MQAFIEGEKLQEGTDQINASVEETGRSMQITAEGNRLIFRCYCEYEEKSESLVAEMQATLAEMSASYDKLAAVLKAGVDVENPVVVVEFIDANGELICSKEYTQE